MILRFIIMALLLSLVTARVSDAAGRVLTPAQAEAVLQEAQAAYDRAVSVQRDDPELASKSFQEAVQRFRQLIDSGVVNGYLHYNLGNAYLQTGDVGRAILQYRAAEELIPGDASLEHNLEYARSLRRSRFTVSGSRALAEVFLGWHDQTRLSTRAAVLLVGWYLLWGSLLLNVFWSAAVWKWMAGGGAVVSLLVGSSIFWDVALAGPSDVGVVLNDNVVVRKGNGVGFEPQFVEALSEGVEFRLREDRGGWYRIELPDGKTGWIQADQAGLVRSALSGSAD